jgi:hypothetical protein
MTGVGPNTADLLHRSADPQFLFLKGSVSDFSFDGASGGPLPGEFLTGYSAAAGIALINSVGTSAALSPLLRSASLPSDLERSLPVSLLPRVPCSSQRHLCYCCPKK